MAHREVGDARDPAQRLVHQRLVAEVERRGRLSVDSVEPRPRLKARRVAGEGLAKECEMSSRRERGVDRRGRRLVDLGYLVGVVLHR